MLVFPNIKLNLGLAITARRADGYHDLETCFLPVPGCGDALEAIPSPDGQTRLFMSGIAIPGAAEANLVLKAYHLLHAAYPLPPLHIYLHKAIPPGTGVGAGSADAAFALKLFAEMGGQQVPMAELEAMALRLGSDCPVFIQNKPVVARGRGEVFSPIKLALEGYWVRVHFPEVHVSTREAFVGIVPKMPKQPIEETLALPVAAWPEHLANDFELPVFALHPELEALKAKLYVDGAVYAAMSGSGSAIFGIFDKPVGETGLHDGVYTGKLTIDN